MLPSDMAGECGPTENGSLGETLARDRRDPLDRGAGWDESAWEQQLAAAGRLQNQDSSDRLSQEAMAERGCSVARLACGRKGSISILTTKETTTDSSSP